MTMLAQAARRLGSLALLAALLGLWEGAIRLFEVPKIILPAPSAVLARLIDLTVDGTIWPHAAATLGAVLAGLGLGIVAGLVIGGAIAVLPVVERLIYPYLVALQTVPKIAIAPLFILWFGYGIASKIVVAALVCFFPVLVSVMAGFHSIDREQLDMMRAFGATRWQTLRYLRLRGALPMIFAGLEIAAVLAVIGAVVGEFVGAQVGLGYLITVLNFNIDVAGVFAVLIVLSAIGMAIHGCVKSAGRRCVFWIRTERGSILG